MRPSLDPDTLSKGPGLEMKECLLDFSLKVVTDFLLGESAVPSATVSKAASWTDGLATEFNRAFKWIAGRERFKSFYRLLDSLEFRRSCSAAQRLVDEQVRRAMNLRETEKLYGGSSESYVALERLLRQGGDPKPIRNHFVNLRLAGRDNRECKHWKLPYAFYTQLE